jgi:ribose 5-phosphate isomerase A
MTPPPEKPAVDRTDLKRAAAQRAIAEIKDGMVVGLGSGSTAELAVEELAKRVARGLKLLGVPTSEQTRTLALRLGVPMAAPDDWPRIDLDIDGADQVERGSLALVKGLGGALLREKIVASASARMVVVVDESKLVDRLGGATPLPVEIVAFGWQGTLDRLAGLGLQPRLRQVAGKPFVSDGGNHVADCAIAEITDAGRLERELSATVGVVETGLFLGLASMVVVGRATGTGAIEIEVMQR